MREEPTRPFDDETPTPEELTATVREELAGAHRHLRTADQLLYQYRGSLLYPAETAAVRQLRQCTESVEAGFEHHQQVGHGLVTMPPITLPERPLAELEAVLQAYSAEEEEEK